MDVAEYYFGEGFLLLLIMPINSVSVNEFIDIQYARFVYATRRHTEQEEMNRDKILQAKNGELSSDRFNKSEKWEK